MLWFSNSLKVFIINCFLSESLQQLIAIICKQSQISFETFKERVVRPTKNYLFEFQVNERQKGIHNKNMTQLNTNPV